jgi:hypothetical protein
VVAQKYAATRLSHAARASLLVSALFVVVVDDLVFPMAKRTRTSGGGPLSPGVAFTSTDLWYINSRAAAPPAAPSPSPSSSSGSATPTAVAFVGDSTFDFQEDAWEEELARRTPRVLIKWRVNGETTEAFARRVRRAKTTTTLARCDHVIVCTGKNDFAFGVAELIRQNTMAAVLVLRAACGPETHIHVLPPTCILKPGYRATAAEVVRLLRSELQQHGDPRISLLTPRTGYARDAWADSLHLAPEAHAHMLRALLDETVGGEGGGGAGEAAPAAAAPAAAAERGKKRRRPPSVSAAEFEVAANAAGFEVAWGGRLRDRSTARRTSRLISSGW